MIGWHALAYAARKTRSVFFSGFVDRRKSEAEPKPLVLLAQGPSASKAEHLRSQYMASKPLMVLRTIEFLVRKTTVFRTFEADASKLLADGHFLSGLRA